MEEKKDQNGLTRHVDCTNNDIQSGMSRNLATLDDEILRAQGHEAVLKRSFSLLSSLGLAFE
ncbi:hypothetical protein PHISCL_00575 [Aspergillus sclerotialis]|uniref:Uncharacterized protein n=1 Tax=Aspergillus sclerotialis TaxID=2070753 RepID=A0A3A2ZVD2_9EURO|nr:hypothetical protein PHISCL_00575 [Aspergillus sclerotialis]